MFYIEPEMEVVWFSTIDLLTTSVDKELDNIDPGITPDVDAGLS